MDKRLTIGQVCEILNIQSHTLRYFEEKLELQIQRDELQNRYYTESNLETLKKVKQLKDEGLSYAAIKKKLSEESINNELAVTAEEVIEFTPNLENIEKVKNVVKDLIVSSINEALEGQTNIIVDELSKIKEKQTEILIQNEKLKESLEKSQEFHFKDLDTKLRTLMENKQNKNTPFISRFAALFK